jgi:PAS domain S-box-containing protein
MDGSRRGDVGKGRIRSGLILCLLVFAAVPPSLGEVTKAGPPLLFLGNKNIAPVLYLENGEPTGLAVDIVRALGRRLSRPVDIRAMDWVEAQKLVAEGRADALIQINATEERRKIFDFSDPLLESHFAIFVRRGTAGIGGIETLGGRSVGVEAGGLPLQLLQKDKSVRLELIPDFLHGFEKLAAGALDAVVVDYRVGSFILAANGFQGIVTVGEPIASSWSAFAVKKGNIAPLSEINAALRSIKSDGTYDTIIEHWKPKEVVIRTREQISQIESRRIIPVLIVLSLVTIVWAIAMGVTLVKRKAAERKLRDNYITLNGIINSANALIFSLDRGYRYTCFNTQHAEVMKAIYGKDIEVGRSILDYMTVAVDRDTAKANIDRSLAGETLIEESYSGEELLSRNYFQVSHSPIRNEAGEVTGVAVLGQDITARRKAEEALNRQNRELRAISACNQTLMRAEEEKVLLRDVCRIACTVAGYVFAWVGYPADDAEKTIRPAAWAGAGDDYLEKANISWAEGEQGNGACGRAIRGGESVCIQDFAAEPQLSRWREEAEARGFHACLALPLKDEDGRIFGTLTVYSTETGAFTRYEIGLLEELAGDLAFGIRFLRAKIERGRIEEELRRMNERFTLAADAAQLGVWDWNLETDELLWDERMYGLYGTKREEFGGNHDAWLSRVHPEDRAPVDELSRLAREGALDYDTEFRVVWPDGSVHFLKAAARVVRDSTGRARRMTGVNFDITVRKNAEEELRGMNEELELRVKARTADLERSNRELEKMNGLFVGRELRMRELKKQIRDLERSLDRKEAPNA